MEYFFSIDKKRRMTTMDNVVIEILDDTHFPDPKKAGLVIAWYERLLQENPTLFGKSVREGQD